MEIKKMINVAANSVAGKGQKLSGETKRIAGGWKALALNADDMDFKKVYGVPNSELGKILGIPQSELMDTLITSGILEPINVDKQKVLDIAEKFKGLGLGTLGFSIMAILEFRERISLYWTCRGTAVIRRLLAELKDMDKKSVSGFILRGIVRETDNPTGLK